MKKTLTLLAFAALALLSLNLSAQIKPAYVRQDTTIFERTGGLPAEVIIRNATKYRTGAAMINAGNGLLQWRNVVDTAYRLNDSTVRTIVGGVNRDVEIKGRLWNWNWGLTNTSTTFSIANAYGGSFTINTVNGSGAGLVSTTLFNTWNGKISTVNVTGGSLAGDGNGSPLTFVNDNASPGINKVYRTDGSGVKGWGDFPAGGGSNAWADITGKPTTISTFGITDGVTFTGSENLQNKTLTSPTFNVSGDVAYDMWYRSPAGIIARLGIGSAGQQLTVAPGGAGYSWAAPPAANQTTLAALRANNSPSTTIPYYITDLNQTGFFYYVGTVSDKTSENGGTTGSGTIIVAGTSAPYKQFKRYYAGQNLSLFWFGGVDDYVYTTGIIGSGTDNVGAWTRMVTAAQGNEPMEIPYTSKGFFFAGSLPDWTYAKTMRLIQNGNMYVDASLLTAPFIRVYGTGGAVKSQRWIQNARVIGRESNTPTHNGNNYGVNSPDYRTYLGTFIEFTDLIQGEFHFKWIQGFGEAIAFNGGLSTSSGGQEVKVWFDRLDHNRIGISMRCPDGTGFLDKNWIMGGMINGDTAIKIDGNFDAVANKTCAFRSNVFSHILIERCNTGIYMGMGDFTYNRFDNLDFEGGTTTGVFGPTKVFLSSTAGTNKIALGTSFTGRGIWSTQYIQDAGQSAVFEGAQFNLPSPSFANVGGFAISGSRSTDLLIIGSDSLSTNSKSVMPSTWDHIAFRGTRYPKVQFANAYIDGLIKYVEYAGFTERLVDASASPYTLKTPLREVSINRTTAVTLLIDPDELVDGRGFYVERLGAGTIDIKRSSDNVTLMASSAITATGFYYVVYNAGITTFEVKSFGGGGGGGGVTSFANASGAGANLQGGTMSGTQATLYFATNLFPGIVSATTQTFGGDKTFAGSVTLRASTTSAYALKWPATGNVLVTGPAVGVEEFDGNYRYITTNTTQHDKYLTENGAQVIGGNTVYNGQPITPAYFSFTCRRVTNANVTAQPGDMSVIVYNQTANRDVIIPTAASAPNRMIWIVQQKGNGWTLNLKDNLGNPVQWMENGGGLSTVLLNDNTVCLHSDGTVWSAVSEHL